MKILLISGIILSTLFSGIIFFRKKDKSLSDKILGVWLIFLALNYLRSYLIFEKEIMFLLGFGYTMPALDAPFFFLYILTLTTGQNKFKARWLWHLTPFLLYNFYLFFFLYIKSPAERLAFFQDTTFFSRPLLFHFFEFIMVLIVPVYVAWSFIYIKNHLRNIRNRFSCKDKIDLNWVRYLLMSVSILWLMIIITKAVSGYYNTLRYNDTLMIIHYFELIIVVVIGYFGFHQEKSLFSFSEVNVPDKNTKKYASTGLSGEQARQIKASLLQYMQTEKPYLVSDLSLQKLSEMTHIPPHHLSQVINELLDKNFYEFVNGYRVDEVKRLIEKNQGQKYTLLSLAHDSGFNSKSTFNSIFKKYTRLTPREYMNKVSG